MFFQGSRYENVIVGTWTDPSGRQIRYKRIRFIPATQAYLAHVVQQRERPDHLAFLAYQDPERFWRICDANWVMRPSDLVGRAGARVLIPPAKG